MNYITKLIRRTLSIIYRIFVNNKNNTIKDMYIKLYIPDYVFKQINYTFSQVQGSYRFGDTIIPDRIIRTNHPQKYFMNCFIDTIVDHHITSGNTQFAKKTVNTYTSQGSTSDIINHFIKKDLFLKGICNIALKSVDIEFVYKCYFNFMELVIVIDNPNKLIHIYDIHKEYVYVKAELVENSHMYKAIISNELPPPKLGKWDGISGYTNEIVFKTDKFRVVDCKSNIKFRVEDKYLLL